MLASGSAVNWNFSVSWLDPWHSCCQASQASSAMAAICHLDADDWSRFSLSIWSIVLCSALTRDISLSTIAVCSASDLSSDASASRKLFVWVESGHCTEPISMEDPCVCFVREECLYRSVWLVQLLLSTLSWWLVSADQLVLISAMRSIVARWL